MEWVINHINVKKCRKSYDNIYVENIVTIDDTLCGTKGNMAVRDI